MRKLIKRKSDMPPNSAGLNWREHPAEKNNLVYEDSGKVKELHNKLPAWRTSVGGRDAKNELEL